MDDYKDHLSTTGTDGKRIRVYPASVRGLWDRRRQIIQGVLLVVFLATPFVTIGDGPALLLDIENRHFFLAGKMFSAQDAPNVLFILGAFLFGIALLTAVFGRAWCGWACPQTVFIEAVFRRIERWTEGDAFKHRRRDQAPWSLEKVFRKTAKWSAFTLCALVITHSMLAYFVGGREAFQMVLGRPSDHPTAFAAVLVMTAVVLFDFGWFREQFCLIACPYGRFQSVLLDEHSVTVSYDTSRSDCIECKKCVVVCPTGIDIRNGWQFECIACTACIDACDSVMEKIKRPKGLVGYRSEGMTHGKPVQWLRGRVLVYFALTFVFSAALVGRWFTHETFRVDVLRAGGPPFVTPQNQTGLVMNHFTLKAVNMSAYTANFSVEAGPGKITLVQPLSDGRALSSGGKSERPLFIQFSPTILSQGSARLPLKVRWSSPGKKDVLQETEVTLVGPAR